MNSLKKVTIPAAGESVKVENFSGKSVIFFSGGFGWDSIDEAATLTFEDQGVHYPAFAGNVWPYSGCGFSRVFIHGTAATAGGTLYMQALPTCENASFNDQPGTYQAVAGQSFTVTTTDAAQTLTELQLADAAGNLPKSITITAQNNPAIYAYDVAPDRGSDLGHILIPAVYTAGSEREVSLLEIEGIDFILKWNYSAAIAGSQSVLTITPRY